MTKIPNDTRFLSPWRSCEAGPGDRRGDFAMLRRGDGASLFVHALRQRGIVRWVAIATCGFRNLEIGQGETEVVPGETREAGLARVLAQTLATDLDAGWRDPDRYALTNLVEWRDILDRSAEDPAYRDFVAAAGYSSILAAMHGCGWRIASADAADPGKGHHLDEICRTWPFLADPLMSLVETGDEADFVRILTARGDAERLASELAATAFSQPTNTPGLRHRPGLPERAAGERAFRLLLRKWRGLEIWISAPCDVLDAVIALPRDWIPSSRVEAAFFHDTVSTLSALVRASAGTLALPVLLRSCCGRWRETRQRMGGRIGDVADMVEAFITRAVLPALLHRGGGAGDEAACEARARRIGWRLLFEGKSIMPIKEASAVWHRSAPHRREFAPMPGFRTWPTPFDRIELPSGAELVALGDSDALLAEGAAMAHCVGSYVPVVAARLSVVASVRRRDADGHERPASTVEFSAWPAVAAWIPRIVQHRGAGNAEAPASDRADLVWLLARWRSEGGLPASVDQPVAAPGPTAGLAERVVADAGFDWRDRDAVLAAFGPWRRFLTRPVREDPLKAVGERA